MDKVIIMKRVNAPTKDIHIQHERIYNTKDIHMQHEGHTTRRIYTYNTKDSGAIRDVITLNFAEYL